MRRQATVCSLVLFTCLVLGHSVYAKGRIVVSNDEWPFSETGFSQAPDAGTFARNIASGFLEGTERMAGIFLVFSSNFSLTGSSPLCQTLRDAGHTCTVDTSLPFDPATLQEFDGVFLAGKVNGGVPDNSVLIQYVENGGNVYLAGGTGIPGGFSDASEEAEAWNTFLHYFGLEFDRSAYNGIRMFITLSITNPLFVGVSSLYQDNGNDIHISFRSQPDTTCQPLVVSDGHILYAVCDPPSKFVTNSDFSLFSLRIKGRDDAKSACRYYEAIKAAERCDTDKLINPITFAGWKRRNGLAVNPDANGNRTAFDIVDDIINFVLHGEVSALYFNAGDLNLARSMHGRSGRDIRGRETVAYYVCNHKTIEDARLNRNLIACVAMDYSVVDGVKDQNGREGPFTKFYVFDNDGKLTSSALLDSQGFKFVPGLCIACHGSRDSYSSPFDAKESPDLGAHFLPFDLDNFQYLHNSRFTREAQETKFRLLNTFIYNTNIADVVKDLLDGWYRDGRRTQDSQFVPQDWDQNKNHLVPDFAKELYLEVVKPSCRTCHSVAGSEDLNWSTYDKFKNGGTKGPVCGAESAYMPNAEVTLNRFWRSQHSHQPDIFRNFLSQSSQGEVKCPVPGSLD
jgi:hypothetical protein